MYSEQLFVMDVFVSGFRLLFCDFERKSFLYGVSKFSNYEVPDIHLRRNFICERGGDGGSRKGIDCGNLFKGLRRFRTDFNEGRERTQLQRKKFISAVKAKREVNMEQKKSMYTGVCEYCGAQKYVEAKSQKQANAEVTFGCDCEAGKEWREEEKNRRMREEVLLRVKKTIANLKKRLLETYNIKLPKETEENILQSSAKVYDCEYETTTIRRGNLTAKICKSNKYDIILDIKIAIVARFEI